MPDNEKTFPKVTEAKTVPKKRTRLSLVWVIPIVAAAAGVWIAVTKNHGAGARDHHYFPISGWLGSEQDQD